MTASDERAALKLGDPVWYLLDRRGGYGYRRAPAVFVRRTERRLVLRVTTAEGGYKTIHVVPSNVRARVGGDEL